MKRSAARSVAWAGVLVVLASAPVFAQSAKTGLEDPALATRFNEVSDRLVCQCGCQMILRVCNMQNCGSAVPMRHEIERQLEDGKTNDEIVQSFVDEHGLKILSAPPAEGVNLAAWVMPGFALLAGLFIVFYFARNWAAKRKLAAVADAESEVTVDPAMRRRIEEDLKNQER